jgi:carboxylesterase
MTDELPAFDLPLFSGPEHEPFEVGDGRAGGALLIHGFPGTPAEMRPLGEWLAGRGWRARGILLPGFGSQFSRMREFNRSDWIAAARTTFEELRAAFGGPALVIGYSMGAAIALHLDVGPADRLALFAPFWTYPGPLPRLIPLVKLLFPELHPVKDGDFAHPEIRAQFERLLPGWNLDDPQVQAAIQERFVLPARAAQEVLKLGKAAYRRAAKIDTNVLVVRGAQDPLVDQDLTLQLIHRMSKSKSTYLEVDAAHNLLMKDSPAFPEVLSSMERFLETGEV